MEAVGDIHGRRRHKQLGVGVEGGEGKENLPEYDFSVSPKRFSQNFFPNKIAEGIVSSPKKLS